MEEVTVTIPAVWLRRVKSPWMFVVATLTGVSITFVPFFLFQLGQAKAEFWDPWVLLCFAIIYLVPSFYMRLAGVVLAQLYRISKQSAPG